MKFHKAVCFTIFSIALLFCGFGVKAQTNQSQKNNVENSSPRKWEYCVIYQLANGQTKDKKVTGIVTITYLEESGERDENVEVELVPKSLQDLSVYNLSLRKALSKAFAQLGNEGWEFIGRFPYMSLDGQEPKLGFTFKRPKQ